MDDNKYFERCLKVAKYSKCKKKRVGAIIVKNDTEISSGYNRPRYVDECVRCLRLDTKGATEIEKCNATHAEEVSILSALNDGLDISGATLYVAALKPKDGEWKTHLTGENFSCVTCAKIIAESNLEFVVTFTKNGPKRRPVREAYYEAFKYLEQIKPLV
ncbi:MAG: deaminase [Candidatus Aenigmarchaeota archaeon]|nr:deaminase [Candidatus Aenigmarchaeota archaeon]